MPQIRRFKHRDGFNGSCATALYVEVVCAEVAVVFPEGRRVVCESVDLADVDDWVDRGWWIEIKD